MTISDIARYLLERRRGALPLVSPADANTTLGTDGLSEALRRRWLVADGDTGWLQVSNDASRVDEMTTEAGTVAESGAGRTATPAAALVLEHARRSGYGVLSETGAPGTGRPGPGYTPTSAPAAPAPVATPAPATTTTTTAAPRTNIGDEVSVAEDGRTYTGRVQSHEPDGRVRISFGPSGRPATERTYATNEITPGRAA